MIKRGHVLFLLISVFIVVTAWVGFNIYHTYVTSTISQDLQTAIMPISPGFDTAALDKLKARKNVAPIYQEQPSTAPTQTIAAPISTQSGQVQTDSGLINGTVSPTAAPASTSASLKGA
jgi:hypothetical protein